MNSQTERNAAVVGQLSSATMNLISAFQRAEEIEAKRGSPYLGPERDALRENIVAMQAEVARRTAALAAEAV